MNNVDKLFQSIIPKRAKQGSQMALFCLVKAMHHGDYGMDKQDITIGNVMRQYPGGVDCISTMLDEVFEVMRLYGSDK